MRDRKTPHSPGPQRSTMLEVLELLERMYDATVAFGTGPASRKCPEPAREPAAVDRDDVARRREGNSMRA